MTVYLADTTVLLHWTRDSRQAKAIRRAVSPRPVTAASLICEVSLGEMLAFGQSLNWGEAKRQRPAEIQKRVVTVDISDRRVLEAYADLSTLTRSSGWSLFHGKNDLWVGAAARATDSHLLTMDRDFLPLRSTPGWRVTVLDDQTGLPLS